MSKGWISVVAGVLLASQVGAADLQREQRIAEQIEEAILVGEPIRLQAGEVAFLAIHAEAELAPRKGAVILLHGRGAHPDWSEVIYPLRSELPGAGWETLSLQLPVAAADAWPTEYRALIPESFPRIDAALAFLESRGIERIVLIAHSLGSKMAVEYLAQGDADEVDALVVIGLSARRRDGGTATLNALEKIRLPLLDLYGSRDLGGVLDSARARAAAAREAANSGYRQQRVPGADHFFRGLDDQLVSIVRGYLARIADDNPSVSAQPLEAGDAKP